jgi:putative membrane protein insertion efficiency factor
MNLKNFSLRQIYLGLIDFMWLSWKTVRPIFGYTSCKYYPSCSEYSRQAFKLYNPIKALLLSTYRIIRCNPFSNGGYDPVTKNPDFSWIYNNRVIRRSLRCKKEE